MIDSLLETAIRAAIKGKTIIGENLILGDLSIYANNAAAKAGGLIDGDVYRTGTGQLFVVYT